MPASLSTSPTPSPGNAPNVTDALSAFTSGMSPIDAGTDTSPTSDWSPYNAFEVLFGSICPYEANHPVFQTLVKSGINTIDSFAYILPDDLDSLSPGDNIWKAHRTRLKLLQRWLITLRTQNPDLFEASYWQHCPHTRQEFDDYSFSHPIQAPMSNNSSYDSSVPAQFSHSRDSSNYGSRTPEVKSPLSLVLSNWNRANRRDKNSYPVLKSERGWDVFQRKFIIQLHADGCENILDHEWKPADAEHKELDALQNKFLFGVLEHVHHPYIHGQTEL